MNANTTVTATFATLVSEANYKCPDINGDKVVDGSDTIIISAALNTCTGNTKYDARGDVNGDNCITNTDLNYVNKYFGKKAGDVTQCQAALEASYKCPDINGDKTVNLQDTMTVSLAYGTCLGDTKYDAREDFNGDNCINDTDLNYVNKYYGKNACRYNAMPKCVFVY